MRHTLAWLTATIHIPSMTEDENEHQALELGEQIAAMTDKELVAAFQKTEGIPGDPYADALLAEIQERNLDL